MIRYFELNGEILSYTYNGSITRFEAGVVYKAYKEGNIRVLKETTNLLYNGYCSAPYCSQRYNQDATYYDTIYEIVDLILENKFEEAQKLIDAFEQNEIEQACKKSPYYHLKKI